MRSTSCGIVLVAALACGKDAAKSPAAASVKNPVTEAQLTTVTITTDAFRRLGIETATVELTTVGAAQSLAGEVVPPPGRSTTIAAPVAGTILAPEGGEIPGTGTQLAANAPILRLVPLPPDRDIVRTQHELTAAESRHRAVAAEASRVAALFADRLVSARDNERAQADLAEAKGRLDAAAAQARMLRGDAGRDAAGSTALVIRAPEGGVLYAMHVAPGQSVPSGAVLAELVRTEQLWVRVPMYAGDLQTLARGASAQVMRLGTTTSEGAISAAPVTGPPGADATAASVDIYYALPRGAAMRPGERVSVSVPLTGTGPRALQVPLAAIVRDASGGAWVYERTDSLAFTRRRVEVARVIGSRAVLARGPAAGTKVVTSGAAELFGTEFGAGK